MTDSELQRAVLEIVARKLELDVVLCALDRLRDLNLLTRSQVANESVVLLHNFLTEN